MPSLFGVLLSWFNVIVDCVWIFFMRQMQGGKVVQWALEDLKLK